MLKRTLAGLAFVLAVSAFNSSPASAFGWCGSGWGWGFGATSSPRAYSYAPRTYYRPRARFYRPAYYGRAFYRPGVRVYRRAYFGRPFVGRVHRPAYYGRAFYRPGVRVYGRDRGRHFVGRAYRPAVARGYRAGVRVSGPRARTFSYRPGARSLRTGKYRGRLP